MLIFIQINKCRCWNKFRKKKEGFTPQIVFYCVQSKLWKITASSSVRLGKVFTGDERLSYYYEWEWISYQDTLKMKLLVFKSTPFK